jgi:F-type H+-transporting ATPase subunit delta
LKTPAPVSARRYARALLDVALLKSVDPSPLKAELADVARVVAKNRELMAGLTLPGLRAERREAVVKAVFSGRVSEWTLRLIAILAEKDRIALLPLIAEAFARAVNDHKGVLSARAVSAVPLEAAQTAALQSALRSATRHEVELETQVDASLLGGVVVTLDGRTYDGSVRGRLAALRKQLRGAAA